MLKTDFLFRIFISILNHSKIDPDPSPGSPLNHCLWCHTFYSKSKLLSRSRRTLKLNVHPSITGYITEHLFNRSVFRKCHGSSALIYCWLQTFKDILNFVFKIP